MHRTDTLALLYAIGIARIRADLYSAPMFELTPTLIALLISTGIIAGIINTLAGGGSNLTLPALMVLGLPADIANASNRVSILFQCIVGARGFSRHGKLDTRDGMDILKPTLVGAAIGALSASFLPTSILKPTLLLAMVTMALLILIRPSVVAPPPGEPNRTMRDTPGARWVLLLAGIYGGFVQAGVGFILIAALAGSLRYDLVRSNALKLLCTGALTAIAMVIFIWRDQIAWIPALLVAAGSMLGAQIGVRLAINASQQTLKWFLFVMTLAASAAAIWL